MKTIGICLCGGSGRMGQELRAVFNESMQFQVVGEISAGGTNEEIDFTKIDVIVDFSSPSGFDKALGRAALWKKPLVSGTTGLAENQFNEMKRASASNAILWSANMSPGVNFLMGLMSNFNKLNGFDFQIEEVHHRHKKDSPSGTALMLKKSLDNAIGKPTAPIVAIRGGGVFGQHRIWAMAEEETLVFEHNALNRRVFARGAALAAQWIVGRPSGLYSMQSVFTESRP